MRNNISGAHVQLRLVRVAHRPGRSLCCAGAFAGCLCPCMPSYTHNNPRPTPLTIPKANHSPCCAPPPPQPPHTHTAPGVLIIEHIVERIALALGMDGAAVREANLLQLSTSPEAAAEAAAAAAAPPTVPPAPPCAIPATALSADGDAPPNGTAAHGAAANGTASGSGTTAGSVAASSQSQHHQQQQPAGPPAEHAHAPALLTTLGTHIKAEQYTLPRMWGALKAASSYEERAAAVEVFNAAHATRQRGLAIVPAKFKVGLMGRAWGGRGGGGESGDQATGGHSLCLGRCGVAAGRCYERTARCLSPQRLA